MKKIKYLAICLMTIILSACNVHEWPEIPVEPEPEILPFTLNLNFDTALPLYTVIEHVSSRASVEDGYDVRYIVNAYKQDDSRNDERTASHQFILSKDDVNNLNYSEDLEIEEGRYIFRVWADYVRASFTEDLYYNTSNFSNISLQGEHSGNNDFRDAFVGEVEADITSAATYVTVEMGRPLAKFNFISTDLEQFIEHVLELRAEAEKKKNREAQANQDVATASDDGESENTANDDSVTQESESESESESDAGEEVTRVVEMTDFKVVFKYYGNMPSAFNMFTNRPSNIQTGVVFNSKLTKLSDTEAELGFDYVFVNGSESIVQVSIDVYDKDGSLISSTDPFDVPLKRSMLTTIKAEFLTSKADGGVGIMPEFDGEFNYEVK